MESIQIEIVPTGPKLPGATAEGVGRWVLNINGCCHRCDDSIVVLEDYLKDYLLTQVLRGRFIVSKAP